MRNTTETERRQLVKECEASGKPKRTWCREKGIPYSTFANWKKGKPKSPLTDITQMGQWADVTPPAESTAAQPSQTSAPSPLPAKIKVIYSGFEIIAESGFDPEHLSGVLLAVRRVCC